MSVIDRVKSHFETLKTITIEVEEWKDEHGNPSVFYSEPLTLEEKNIIFKKNLTKDLFVTIIQINQRSNMVFIEKSYYSSKCWLIISNFLQSRRHLVCRKNIC